MSRAWICPPVRWARAFPPLSAWRWPARSDNKTYRVYAILGDGEIAEGQAWEAAMSAAKYHLDNLCAVVDVNGLADRRHDRWTSCPPSLWTRSTRPFGWHVIKIDGHDFDQIDAAFQEAQETKGQPTVILAKTVKGKGVSFMENNAGWHGKAPNDEQYAQAVLPSCTAISEQNWRAT